MIQFTNQQNWQLLYQIGQMSKIQRPLSKMKSALNITNPNATKTTIIDPIKETSTNSKATVLQNKNQDQTLNMRKVISTIISNQVQQQNQSSNICTNNIIVIQNTQKTGKTIYIPCYYRIKVQNIDQINLSSLNGSVKTTMLFTLKVQDLPEFVIQKLKNQIMLNFQKEQPIKLSSGSQQIIMKLKTKKKLSQNQSKQMTQSQKLSQIQFVIRKILKFKIHSDIFWSPFQIINLVLSVSIKTITINISSHETLSVKFNLMDFTSQAQPGKRNNNKNMYRLDMQSTFMKLSYGQKLSFGQYNMAEALIDAQYSSNKQYQKRQTRMDIQNQQKQWKKQLKKIQNNLKDCKNQNTKLFQIMPFQNAHFSVPLYQYPNVVISTILIPMLFLALINLAIFFQDNELAGRIGSIGAIMIAFVSLIPTIRSQIPPNRYVIFIQIIVYLQVLTCSLALIDSLLILNVKKYKLKWHKNIFFLWSLLITLLNLALVIGLVIKYKFISLKKYHYQLTQKQKSGKFDSRLWKNKQCTEYFNLFKNIYKISIYNKDSLKKEEQTYESNKQREQNKNQTKNQCKQKTFYQKIQEFIANNKEQETKKQSQHKQIISTPFKSYKRQKIQ